jgi:peroxiredoxin
MVDIGDEAPDFTAPLANGGIETFTLSEHLDEAPIVIAFFPAAFTPTCTNEMCALRDHMSEFEAIDATVYGISVDLPYTLNEFREQHGLTFGLISDERRELIDAYDVGSAFSPLDMRVAQRAVFIVDGDGRVTYRWLGDNPKQEPEYEAVREAAADVTA